MSIEVRDLDESPQRLSVLAGWIVDEWGGDEEEVKRQLLGEASHPKTQIAFSENALVGVLSFTLYPAPAKKGLATWINTLYVAPAARTQGVATELLRSAVEAAANTQLEFLYVYTNMPSFYTKRGWLVVETPTEPDMHVLRRNLR